MPDTAFPSDLPAYYPMAPIAHVHTAFPSKFGVPRQSGLVDALEARVVFEPPYRNRDALRGLDGFSHIWLVWVFHRNLSDKQTSSPNAAISSPNAAASDNKSMIHWSPTVRPPRLGGNQRLGVFATRSPFRPNPIGLSCVRLTAIDDTPAGPVLRIRGADLVDGTPVLDIKPYLPYADCVPDASGGFADTPPSPLHVEIPPDLLAKVPEGDRAALYGVLAQDPRPHYHDDPARVYGFGFAGLEVRFSVDGQTLTVREILRP